MLSNKSNMTIAPKTGRQLNPIQFKKTIRPPSQRTTIDCNKISINNSNNLKSEHKGVYEFLKDLNMESYLEQFVKNGINTAEKILYSNNDNLKLINMPYAHRSRFLKKLKEIETMQLMKKTITEKGGLSKVKVKKSEKTTTKYEEIYIPKEEDDIDIGEEEQSKTFAQAIFEYQKTHSKFEGQENKELFKTGVNNMNRNTDRKKNLSKITNRYSEINDGKIKREKKEVEIQNNMDEDNKSRKSEGVGENIEPIEIGEYIENKNLEIKKYNNPTEVFTDGPRVFFPLNKPKTLCYNCLHLILEEHCIQKFKKPFCSLRCLEIYEKKNVTNCNCCDKKIEILNSIPSTLKEKIYYCSSECLQKKEPNEKLINNKSQIMDKINSSHISSDGSENNIDILDF